MKIQIASDLHLEHYHNNSAFKENPSLLDPQGDVLVLAGDICTLKLMDNAKHFFDYCSENFTKVIRIPGNHEYYGIGEIRDYETPFVEENGNHVFCNNHVVVVDDVRFICSTMWSGVSEATTSRINDYYAIEGFDKEVENKAHAYSVEFIKTSLETAFEGKTVVVTHHLPLLECISPRFVGDPMNDAFASDQTKLFEYDIDLWVYGHTHDSGAMVFNDTTVVANPYGYNYREQENYDHSCVVEL